MNKDEELKTVMAIASVFADVDSRAGTMMGAVREVFGDEMPPPKLWLAISRMCTAHFAAMITTLAARRALADDSERDKLNEELVDAISDGISFMVSTEELAKFYELENEPGRAEGIITIAAENAEIDLAEARKEGARLTAESPKLRKDGATETVARRLLNW